MVERILISLLSFGVGPLAALLHVGELIAQCRDPPRRETLGSRVHEVVAHETAPFGAMPCNRFLIGRMDTSRNATAASKKIDAAGFLRQAAHAEAAALVRYLHLNLFKGASRFLQRAFPQPKYHFRTCTRRAPCFRKIWFR
jgi:hypothetical protein